MTLLIVGASGLLGANLLLTTLDRGRPVAAATRAHPIRSRATSHVVDLGVPGAALDLLRDVRPSAVVNAAAMTDVDACEADPAEAHRVNARMAGAVAAAAADVGARLVHVSTDAVFAGDADRPYLEEDRTGPLNAYGAAKLAGEQAVLAAHPGALVARTTIFGWNALPKRSLAEYFLDRLRNGVAAPGFHDAFMTPILVNDLADLLLRLLDTEARGVLHVTGSTCLSKADFGQRIARAFGCPPSLVKPVPVASARFSAPRALRPCLGTERAVRLLGPMPDADAGIVHMRELEDAGLRFRLRTLLEDAL